MDRNYYDAELHISPNALDSYYVYRNARIFPLILARLKLVKTKGYGVRATTIEVKGAFAPMLCFAQVSRQNTRDQITIEETVQTTRDHDFVPCIPLFLVEVQTKLGTYVSCMRNRNLEIRIAGSSCRPQ